jgi:hypothetical protein
MGITTFNTPGHNFPAIQIEGNRIHSEYWAKNIKGSSY